MLDARHTMMNETNIASCRELTVQQGGQVIEHVRKVTNDENTGKNINVVLRTVMLS